MPQTEQEYLHTLKTGLTGYVSREDLDDILSDYAEHFSIGKSEGRSEEELFRALGSPEDVAKEIRATYLVKKAEQTRSAENIWHAVIATLGLGLFNSIFVLIPFILVVVLLVIIFIAGMAMLVAGPVLMLVAVMQLIGVAIPVSWWSSPLKGLLSSIAISIIGVVMVIVDLHLARYFYHITIRYLKWNIHVIRGGEAPEQGEPVQKVTSISRDGATDLDLQMLFGAGEITLGEGTDDQTLVKLTSGSDSSPAPLDYHTSRSGTVKTVRIRGRHPPGSWCSDESACGWDIRLNRDVPLSLDIRNKAGRIRLALGDLSLSALKIRNGAGETCIDLTGYHGGSFDATVKNGVGSLVIRVPKECNMRVRIHRGIGDSHVRGFFVDGDTYLTRPDNPGAPQITFYVKQGIGSLSLEAV
jgi:uncharacterized membrane protein